MYSYVCIMYYVLSVFIPDPGSLLDRRWLEARWKQAEWEQEPEAGGKGSGAGVETVKSLGKGKA